MNNNEFKRMKESRRHGDELLPIMHYSIEPEDDLSVLDCHWHNEMEFFRVMHGVFTMQCGNSIFEARAGDIVFFNSGELHAAVAADGDEDLCFQAVVFSPDFLSAATNDIIRIKYTAPVMNGEIQVPRLIAGGTALHRAIAGEFDAVCDLLDRRPFGFEMRAKICVLSAFAALVENGETLQSPARHSATAESIKRAIGHIQENYKNTLTIEALSSLADMSEGHFCRVFKQYTLKTPIQFINGVRLTHAADDLTNTNKRILDIAMDCGFNSVSYFIEVFREYFNTTPSKYRKG